MTAPPTPMARLIGDRTSYGWSLRFESSGIEQTSLRVPGGTLASTLLFGADGTLKGETGFSGSCDVFVAPYDADDDALTIGPLSGQLSCPDAGALEVRARLRAVVRYEFLDDTLILRGVDGQQLLVYAGSP
ncbi:MAG: META domain-containing protein [Acidimicrobiales bacterium]